MGEGVDPTKMCQSLVEKVSRSEQLMAIAEPGLLVLFEDWLEELESEAGSILEKHGELTPQQLAEKLGLSVRGASFLLTKLKQSTP
jgi:CRP-like cAMP-binding protein